MNGKPHGLFSVLKSPGLLYKPDPRCPHRDGWVLRAQERVKPVAALASRHLRRFGTSRRRVRTAKVQGIFAD